MCVIQSISLIKSENTLLIHTEVIKLLFIVLQTVIDKI